MNLFYDTSVLVAASAASHPHYRPAFHALSLSLRPGNRGWMSQHSIAEVFSALATAPLSPRVQPEEALRILEENLLPHLGILKLDPADYRQAVRSMAAAGLAGGKIYDGLLLRCAEKQRMDRIYTFNTRDFLRLAPAGIRERVQAPA